MVFNVAFNEGFNEPMRRINSQAAGVRFDAVATP
jgi:hypothetical protein